MPDYTLEDKYDFIKQNIIKCTSEKNPIAIALNIMRKDFINLHGPEHHFLDGAAFLTAYRNADGVIDLDRCLDELAKRTVKMPGAMCGHWGICGSLASVGAALSILHGTSPLSTDEHYKQNMEYTAAVLAEMSKIGGARCCKRNAFLSLSLAAKFVKEKYNVEMESGDIQCEFSPFNNQCLKNACPFYHT
jgi:hypothetical protein